MQATVYLDRGTFFHRLDPRGKMVALAAFFVIALAFNHPAYAAGTWVAIVAVAAAARSLGNLWRIRALLIMLFVFATVLWPFFVTGPTPLLRFGPVTASRESLLYGLAVGLRLSAMVAGGMVFMSATMVEELAHGLRRFGVPFAVSFALAAAVRLVPTFLGSSSAVVEAQKSRGLDLESGNIFARLRKHVPVLVPVFVTAIRSTDLTAMALESKGFGAHKRRTYYLELRMRAADWVCLALALAAAAGAVYARLQGYGEVLPRL
ncbi:MAG: energy-coupling factor transporter transmembrane protein EcfT [Armatimonadota bacterium]|nr:MAG: energy-coupling factor transporter transmembrane protein EcfT [Armatimonadota bacterium]